MPYSKIKLYKQNANKEKFVVVYYRHGEDVLRHRTGVTVIEKNWDKKSELVKAVDSDSTVKNEIIKSTCELVEQIISDFILENGLKPSSTFVKKELLSGRQLRKEKIEANVIDCFDEFLNEKRIQFSSPDKSMSSLKDYKSTQNALLDYTALKGHINPVDLNNQTWLTRFNIFLSAPREPLIGYKFKTHQQNDKTRAKRYSVLKEFGKWLLKKKYLKSTDVLNEFKVKIQNKKYYALSLNEVKTIQTHQFNKTPHQKAIDMFIIACHTGVRISDVGRINKARIHHYNKVDILIMNNIKTKEKIEVPLTRKAKEILVKYDYNLNLMSEQKVNDYLHEALKQIKCFEDEYEYGIEGDSKPKYELITFHTGRRTFITNLVNNNVSLNAIMKMTGHKKIATLQKYINPDYELMIENVKIFNEL